jgi:hypothetical protein
MLRWALSPCHMGNRPLHCGLPRTSIAGMHCTELVCEVRICFSLHLINILLILLHRCQGHRTDLDGDLSKFPRTRNFTEEVIEHCTVSELWDDFGIVSDVIVINVVLVYDAFLSQIFFTSPSPMISNVPTYMSSLLLTYFIKSSREHLRTTW